MPWAGTPGSFTRWPPSTCRRGRGLVGSEAHPARARARACLHVLGRVRELGLAGVFVDGELDAHAKLELLHLVAPKGRRLPEMPRLHGPHNLAVDADCDAPAPQTPAGLGVRLGEEVASDLAALYRAEGRGGIGHCSSNVRLTPGPTLARQERGFHPYVKGGPSGELGGVGAPIRAEGKRGWLIFILKRRLWSRLRSSPVYALSHPLPKNRPASAPQQPR